MCERCEYKSEIIHLITWEDCPVLLIYNAVQAKISSVQMDILLANKVHIIMGLRTLALRDSFLLELQTVQESPWFQLSVLQ
jgi:hypothetical protein